MLVYMCRYVVYDDTIKNEYGRAREGSRVGPSEPEEAHT